MARVFERGLTKPSGYRPARPALAGAAPTARAGAPRSGRRGAAGCSWCPATRPVGYRLPLGSLPYVPPAAFPYVVPVDPTVPRGPLPDRSQPALPRACPSA